MGERRLRAAPQLYVEWIEDEAVVLDPDTKEVHHLNTPAAVVLALVQEHGYEHATVELERRYPDSPGMREELPRLIAEMTEKGLLVQDDRPLPRSTTG